MAFRRSGDTACAGAGLGRRDAVIISAAPQILWRASGLARAPHEIVARARNDRRARIEAGVPGSWRASERANSRLLRSLLQFSHADAEAADHKPTSMPRSPAAPASTSHQRGGRCQDHPVGLRLGAVARADRPGRGHPPMAEELVKVTACRPTHSTRGKHATDARCDLRPTRCLRLLLRRVLRRRRRREGRPRALHVRDRRFSDWARGGHGPVRAARRLSHRPLRSATPDARRRGRPSTLGSRARRGCRRLVASWLPAPARLGGDARSAREPHLASRSRAGRAALHGAERCHACDRTRLASAWRSGRSPLVLSRRSGYCCSRRPRRI